MIAASDLREAAAWRLRGLLMERPRPGWIGEVQALAREVGDASLTEAARAAAGATEGEYLAWLGPGGGVPAREVAYREGEDPARVLSGLAAFYEAFAYAPRAEDPADHIAVEAGFVGYLILKEAAARAAGEQAHAETTARSLARFRADHFDSFARRLAEKLAACGGYLEAAARTLVASR